MTCYATVYGFSQAYRHNTSSFLNEGEDSHDDGIWTRPRFTTTFSVSGPDFHVSFIRSTDLGIDTLVQHES
jgi:hypothetical protein